MGLQSKGNDRGWSPLPSNRSEGPTMDTNVSVIVNCKVQSLAVSKCAVNPITKPNPSIVKLYHVTV
jgi:hypothetical protein